MKKIVIFTMVLASILILTGCGKKLASPPAPSAPSNLSATLFLGPTIRASLGWNDNSNDEKGFYLYRKTTGQYSKIATLDPNTISYIGGSLNLNTTYWYKITAYNDGGESNSSNETSIKTPG